MSRQWTKEQKLDLARRTRERWAAKRGAMAVEVPKVRPPEVQAVIDSMTPERRAKLEMIQARTMANVVGPEDKRAVQEALLRRDAVRDERRIGSREVSLIVRTDGTMVSLYGPCVCGKAKKEWHRVCLAQQVGSATEAGREPTI